MKSFSHKKGLLYLMVCGFLILSGCEAEMKNKQVAPITPQAESPSPKKDEVQYYSVDDFSYTVKGSAEPHHYNLSILWPKTSHIITVMINKKVIKEVKPEEVNSFTTVIPDGSQFVVKLLSESNSALKEWSFETPKDFVFNSTEILSQDTVVKADRIFFKDKSFIETREFKFSIEADEVIFDEGTHIINFATPAKIISEKEGLNGGNITILARTAKGKIQLDLNGGDGGKGMKAFPWVVPHADGKDGIAGRCEGGGLVPTCTTQPIDAENSPNGNLGKTGFPGLKGGNSGSVVFEIIEQSALEVTHTERPGLGGEGGDGGLGQIKGKPGKGVSRLESCLCESAKDGEDTGKNGEPGKPGTPGPSGDYGLICISIGRGSGVCNR